MVKRGVSFYLFHRFTRTSVTIILTVPTLSLLLQLTCLGIWGVKEIYFIMKKIFLLLVILYFSCSIIFAESVVYIFARQSWTPIPIKINNQKVFEMKGNPIGKGTSARLSACKKKCTLKSEGKVIISFNMSVTHPVTKIVFPFASEIQLNLSENSVHYIEIGYKGINDMQIKEIPEKSAQKLLKANGYVLLSDYVEI